jgi:hypothetical protein
VPVRFDDSTPSKSLDYLLATVHWLAIPAESRERSIGKAAEQIAQWLTNFIKNPATPLPLRGSTVQAALVTQLRQPAKHGGIAIAAILSLALAGAGAYATGHLPFSKKSGYTEPMSTAPKSLVAIPPVPATASLGRKLVQPNRRTVAKARESAGYAGVPNLPVPPASGSTNRDEQTHSRIPGQAQGQTGQFGPPPPPPGMSMPPNSGTGPGAGAPMNAGYPPPPPPPAGPGRRPMFGGPNGPGPGQAPGPGEPRP